MSLRTHVQKYIVERDLLRPGDTLVLGVSGGPDSLCLLDLLHALAADLALTLHVAHLNHGLRPEAAAEADFVRAQTEARGLAFHTEMVDTPAHARMRKKSVEEAARDLRYDFLARAALAVGACTIAVAHNADDQAETVLMHFLRGSGLAGLRGMRPKVGIGELGIGILDLYLIRPLLTTPRSDIEAYCAERHLHPRQDATNLDTTYFRNRLRHELLPQLASYNPNIRAVLQRMAEVMTGEHEMLRGLIEKLWADVAQEEQGRVKLDKAAWSALTPPEQRALLREAARRLRPGLRNVDFAPLAQAVQFSRTAASGRSCDLLGGLRLAMTPAHLVVSAWGDESPTPAHLPLVSTDGQLSEGWKFHVETLAPGEWSPDEAASNSSDWRVHIDAARIQAPLRVRARLPGDRFHPLGMEGHSVKVSDFMINAKVEEALRSRWPLVVSGEAIVWLAGLRLDERFKVTPATKTVMRLGFMRVDKV